LVLVLQESVVQVLLSLQSAPLVQQPVNATCWQVRFARLQTSSVQVFASLHCALLVQQLAIGVFEQTPGVPPEVSQVSVVQAFASLHCAATVHEPSACCTDAVVPEGESAELHRIEPSASAHASAVRSLLVMSFPRRWGESGERPAAVLERLSKGSSKCIAPKHAPWRFRAPTCAHSSAVASMGISPRELV
jgi:hypothetical protein